MDHPLLGPGYNFHADTGGWINANYERVARFIKDYDEELELGWIPPDKREQGDIPYCIIHNHPNGTRQAVSFWHEAQLNIETIAVWLMENDFARTNPNEIFDRMVATQLAKELADAKVIEDEAEEAWDWGKSLLRSPKFWYKHNGKVYRN